MNKRVVGVNEKGRRVGEDHQRAKLSDHDVDLIRELHEPSDESTPLGYGAIAKKFACAKATIRDICKARRRWQVPSRYKTIGAPSPQSATVCYSVSGMLNQSSQDSAFDNVGRRKAHQPDE